ncbi:MAG: thermonuclease family protein [Candidatus Saccharimonadales bacterium]
MARRLLAKRQRNQLISIVLTLLLAGAVWLGQRQGLIDKPAAKIPPPGTYTVSSFEDGDTITVDMNGTPERVRMIGVDTPETQDPRVPVQCYGKAASQFTKQLIGSSPVRLEADPTNTNRDRYNRLLRYVYLPDGRLVNAEIIRAGYGFAYTLFPFEKLEEFRGYESQAREQNLGLWGNCNINEQDQKKTTNSA